MSDAPYVRIRDDGVVEYRASALGGCDMALLAARLGYDAIPLKVDSPIMKAFDRGNRIEDEVMAKMVGITERQQEIYLDITNKLKVVGHIDGYHRLSDTVIEVKSQRKEPWDLFKAYRWNAGLFPKYKWQVSCYMHAYQAPLRLIRVLVDENGEQVEEDHSFVDEPFYSIAEIRARMLRVEATAATGVLAAECQPTFPCPYFYLHDEIDRELIDDEAVDALAHEYEDARADEKAAGGRKDAVRRALREAVEQDRYRTTSGIRVTFYTSKNPPRLDREILDPFLEKHGRKFEDFTTQGESERLRVTLPKEVEQGDGSEP